MNYYEFNKEGTILRKHQLRMLVMLSYIDTICRENNIKYWLAGGTLLGAVRHQGFIPWDDDVDIELFKEDFDRLLTLLSADSGSGYSLQTSDTDKNYFVPYAKLRDNKSLIYERDAIDCNLKYRGVYIDIFCIEKALPVLLKVSQKMQAGMLYLSFIKNDKLGVLLFIKRLVFCGLKNIVYPLFDMITRHHNTGVYSYSYGSYFIDKFTQDALSPLMDIKFENRIFKAPENYDAYLKIMYGDYMLLPDISDLRIHTDKVEIYE